VKRGDDKIILSRSSQRDQLAHIGKRGGKEKDRICRRVITSAQCWASGFTEFGVTTAEAHEKMLRVMML
jgi:hypothetical protein